MPQRTIHFWTAVNNAKDFATLAQQASVLKKYGPIEMIVSSQAEGTRADIPEGGSPWHSYTDYLPTWQKFFPHEKMQPFLDMKHVARNRALLAESLKIIRKHGYTAGFATHTPFFLPEAFFEKYPHLRGARVDHPRRTRKEAFALCVDQPETLDMYRDMAAEMIREIPELTWLRMLANDAGSGLCWSDWLYSGPNGPAHCRHISTAQRVVTLAEAIQQGFGNDNRVVIGFHGNFSDEETREIAAYHSDSLHVQQHWAKKGHAYTLEVSSWMDNPVRGIFDPVGILKSLQRWRDPAVQRLSFYFRMQYSRGHELEDVQEKIIEIVDAFLSEPAYGTFESLALLRKLCAKWVGDKKRDELLEAFLAFHEAAALKHAVAPRFSASYCGVSMRAVTRPLVIMPEKLTAEEEAYFLPHVFNPDVNEGRIDYLDWHGGKLAGSPVNEVEVHGNPRLKAVDQFCEKLGKIASTLTGIAGTPSGDTIARMGTSLRLHACVMRSINNMFAMGTVRDRNMAKLTAPPMIPPKLGDWIGDPDLQILNGAMRDELDNTADMLAILESGGLRQMLLAEKPEDEDTFILGPDLVENLRQKMKIMRRHWLDAQAYLHTPHK